MSELVFRRLPVATSLGHFEDLQGRVNMGELPACSLDPFATSELLGRNSVGCFFDKNGNFRRRETPEIEGARAKLETILGSTFYHGPNKDSRIKNYGWHDDHLGLNAWDLHLQGRVFEKRKFRKIYFAQTGVRLGGFQKKPSPEVTRNKVLYTGKISLGWGTYFKESAQYLDEKLWYGSHYFKGDGLWTYFRGFIDNDRNEPY